MKEHKEYFELAVPDNVTTLSKRDKMEMFLEWELVPKPYRVPSTLSEVADILNVSRQTLYGYRKDDWFIKEKAASALMLAAQSAPELIDNLLQRALNKEEPLNSVNAATRTILEYSKMAKIDDTATDADLRRLMILLEDNRKRLKELDVIEAEVVE